MKYCENYPGNDDCRFIVCGKFHNEYLICPVVDDDSGSRTTSLRPECEIR